MFGLNPAIFVLTDVPLLPEIGLSVAAFVLPYPVVVPYSNVTLVMKLLALTNPFKVAQLVSTLVASAIVGMGVAQVVEKKEPAEYTIPPQLSALIL